MSRQPSRSELTPEAMAARLAPHIDRAAATSAIAKDERRARFPLMAELVDQFRAADMQPRPVFARNAAGETWGNDPSLNRDGLTVDGVKLAHLPEFEASWRRFYAKQTENQKTYNERAQRAIKPHMRGIEK